MYESSIAFGIRKALQAEQGKTDMENYIAKLEEGGRRRREEKEVMEILVLRMMMVMVEMMRRQRNSTPLNIMISTVILSRWMT